MSLLFCQCLRCTTGLKTGYLIFPEKRFTQACSSLLNMHNSVQPSALRKAREGGSLEVWPQRSQVSCVCILGSEDFCAAVRVFCIACLSALSVFLDMQRLSTTSLISSKSSSDKGLSAKDIYLLDVTISHGLPEFFHVSIRHC
jgi:hypothetical protein